MFEFIVLNFGMTIALSTFVTYMNELFSKNKGKKSLVHIDDIIINSPTKGQHDKDLQVVLDTLQKKIILAKLARCMF